MSRHESVTERWQNNFESKSKISSIVQKCKQELWQPTYVLIRLENCEFAGTIKKLYVSMELKQHVSLYNSIHCHIIVLKLKSSLTWSNNYLCRVLHQQHLLLRLSLKVQPKPSLWLLQILVQVGCTWDKGNFISESKTVFLIMWPEIVTWDDKWSFCTLK